MNRLIKKIDENERLMMNLSELYRSEFKRDWVGRWYTVLNPLVQDMTADGGTDRRIFEFTEKGLSDKTYIEKWCMDRMFAASNFIKNKELLDIMTYSLEKLDNNQNYLFVLKPILFNDLIKTFKRFSIFTVLLIVALVVLGIVFL
jgi:hypothetical protein